MVATASFPVHVICFGNAWHGDDGVGMHVYRRLVDRALPPGTKVLDGGIAGIGALDHFLHCRTAVVVDAITTGRRAGSIHRFDASDLGPAGAELSMHRLGVAHVLTAVAAMVDPPERPTIVVIGIEVGDLSAVTDQLTPPVEDAVDRVVGRIERECRVAATPTDVSSRSVSRRPGSDRPGTVTAAGR